MFSRLILGPLMSHFLNLYSTQFIDECEQTGTLIRNFTKKALA